MPINPLLGGRIGDPPPIPKPSREGNLPGYSCYHGTWDLTRVTWIYPYLRRNVLGKLMNLSPKRKLAATVRLTGPN